MLKVITISSALLLATAANAGQSKAQIDALCQKLGNVRIGLNSTGVLKSCWGKPKKINTTTTANHVTEQWVYGGASGVGYLYFTDGLVTGIQN